jgi:hypothetical protein
MGDDVDQETGAPVNPSFEDDSGKVEVGSLVQDELASIKGMAESATGVVRGPRPRVLSQARIDVKSEPHSPRVRSHKLQPLRRVRTGPSPLLEVTTPDTEGSLAEAPSSRVAPKTAPMLPDMSSDAGEPGAAPARRRLFEPLQVVTGMLLLETALMPSLRARHVVAPWSAWTDPASPNFVAVSFMALLGLFFAFPLSRFFRTALHGLTAALLIVFSLVLLRSALASRLFDGQPALHALFIDGLTGGLVVILTICVIVTALLWLHMVPESRRARGCLLAGVALTLVTYFGMGAFTSLAATPLTLLLAASSESPFLGDRIAASVALVPLLGVAASMAVWLPGERGRVLGLLAGAVWAFSIAPLMILALYVAPTDSWQDVLVPIQISSLLAAGLLLVPTSLGHVCAVREVGDI